jgi:hypothetical protein
VEGLCVEIVVLETDKCLHSVFTWHSAIAGKGLCKEWSLLGNHCNNHTCSNSKTEEQCFLVVHCQGVIIGKVYCAAVQFVKKLLLEWQKEIHSEVTLHWKVVVVEELTENCCG